MTDATNLPNGNQAVWWRGVATSLLTLYITGLAGWLLFVKDQPTRFEVREIVRTELAAAPNPYGQDKRSLDETVQVVSRLRDDLAVMKGQLAEIIRRLGEPPAGRHP